MSSSAYRIGFVLEGMAGPGSGVWSRFDSLARGLANGGASVHVLAEAHLQAELKDLPLSSLTTISRQSKVRRFTQRRVHIDRFVARSRIDVVHVEAPPFPEVTGAISIASVHDLRYLSTALSRVRTTEAIYQRLLLKRQVRNMTGVATLGPWAQAEVSARLGLPAHRVHQIPPIVVGKPDPEPDPSAQGGEQFVLVLGHLETRKNVATIVRAAASKEWPSGLGIVIAGADAGEGPALRALAASARCRVTFLGQVTDAAKWQLLRRATLVLVPSLLEGFGIVAVEAPLAGTAVLVSDRTALPDVAGDSRAIVPALDPETWGERVALLVSDDALRQQVLEQQVLSARRFSPEVVIPQVLATYRQLIHDT